MEFPDLTEEEDKICNAEGFRIFGELRKKYSNQCVRDLDIVFNSLCNALIRLGELNCRKEDYRYFIELVTSVLKHNMIK